MCGRDGKYCEGARACHEKIPNHGSPSKSAATSTCGTNFHEPVRALLAVLHETPVRGNDSLRSRSCWVSIIANHSLHDARLDLTSEPSGVCFGRTIHARLATLGPDSPHPPPAKGLRLQFLSWIMRSVPGLLSFLLSDNAIQAAMRLALRGLCQNPDTFGRSEPTPERAIVDAAVLDTPISAALCNL